MIETASPIHAVIVAYHAADELDTCLAALDGQVPVTVVDNSTCADVRDVAHTRGAEYIDSGENLGFAAGVNRALQTIAESHPTDVLVLNPDAVLTPTDLGVLVDFLHAPGNERVAVVSPRLVGTDGHEQRVVWPFPTPARAWAEAVGLGRLRARRTFVVGAVMLVRWKALDEVGLFDERYFLYAEETDWQLRAYELGWSSRLCAASVATHLGGGTSRDPIEQEKLFHAAHETYIRKWNGTLGWLVYRLAAFLGASARALLLVGERRSQASRRARLYLLGPRRCATALRD